MKTIFWLLTLSSLASASPYGKFSFSKAGNSYSPSLNFPELTGDQVPNSLKPYIYEKTALALVEAGENFVASVDPGAETFTNYEYSYIVNNEPAIKVIVDSSHFETELPVAIEAEKEVIVSATGIRADGSRLDFDKARALVISRWGKQINFALPAKSDPTFFGGAGNGTVKLTYDKMRMVDLGANPGRKLFVVAQIRFLDAARKIILQEQVRLGDFTTLLTETALLKAPTEARQAAIWFEGSMDMAGNVPPDLTDGDATHPYIAVVND